MRKVTFYNGKEIVTEFKPVQACVFGVFTNNGILDFLRCFFFIYILNYNTKTYSYLNPLPFTWIFDDFPKFLFEPTCIKIFWKYLKQEEPHGLQTLEKIMRLYLTSNQMSHFTSLQNSLKTREDYEESKKYNFQQNLSNVIETDREYQENAQSPSMMQNQLQGSLLKKQQRSRTNTFGMFDSQQAMAFNRYLTELYPHFESFKKTKSFDALKDKLRQFELISEQVYQN